MAENTNIAWADHTFNPWIGCSKVSAGCANCYAEAFARNRMGLSVWGDGAPRKVTAPANWRKPLLWNRMAELLRRPARVFCGSLCDVFELHRDVEGARARLWDLIRATPHLIWLLLTKRPENIRLFMPEDFLASPWPNVWLGVTVESWRKIDRARMLVTSPAAGRFISYEPAIGPLLDLPGGIGWVICGGESGPGRRPFDPSWACELRAQCARDGIPFFFKQGSALWPGRDALLDGEVVQELPEAFYAAKPCARTS